MRGLNSLVLGGHLSRDPELRTTVKGDYICTFGLAISPMSAEEDGKTPQTLFIDVVCWHRQAESCAAHLKKGRLVVVEGRLSMRRWEDRFQAQKFHYEVVARAVHFLDDRVGEGAVDNSGAAETTTRWGRDPSGPNPP